MKYEFHIGDYVETKGGVTGYISSIGQDGTCGQVVWKYNNSINVNLDVNFKQLINDVVRIGQYDFTKPEQPKEIERLEESEWPNLYIGKINELVDAVNELRKDKNE